ncbi:MAG: gamma-glutamyl-gamma-aminobutyrate hydrolase family protein [Candidatus Riflebacteria bacterium]|nr:gamma-glutamyl-gamma-aminobutyrate hydrolase family protein [Candidatus Riflebacteria bacterium]
MKKSDSPKPLIGMTYSETSVRDEQMKIRTYCGRNYYMALQRAGARVILLPPVDSRDEMNSLLDMVDGLLLPGGEDVDPRYQNEDPSPLLGGVNPYRDAFELEITRLAFARRIPTLGICRGIQVMAIALGGSVHQDITSLKNVIQHSQNAPRWAASHRISFESGAGKNRMSGKAGPGSRLAGWMNVSETHVNSFHHQSVNNVPVGLHVVARTGDGLIEAMESVDNRIFVGVQWHPEELASGGDELAERLFSGFVTAAQTSGALFDNR